MYTRHVQTRQMSDFFTDLFGAGEKAANDLTQDVRQTIDNATSTVDQGIQLVSRAEQTQAALVRLDQNVETLKPVIWGTLIIGALSLAIIAYKQFR